MFHKKYEFREISEPYLQIYIKYHFRTQQLRRSPLTVYYYYYIDTYSALSNEIR